MIDVRCFMVCDAGKGGMSQVSMSFYSFCVLGRVAWVSWMAVFTARRGTLAERSRRRAAAYYDLGGFWILAGFALGLSLVKH